MTSIIEDANNLSRQEALDIILKDPMWRKVKGEISIENDQVVSSMKRPFTIVNHFITVESDKKRINGRVRSVAVVK
jgi:hypothetical protein